MLELLILFAQFWGALFVVGLAGTLLAKIHLLPAVLYVMIVKTVAPAWVEAEHTKYLLILAALGGGAHQIPAHSGGADFVRRPAVGAEDHPLASGGTGGAGLSAGNRPSHVRDHGGWAVYPYPL